jgi:hypothetical protein
MPRVKKLSTDADSLVAVKKRVNKKNKQKYAAETGAPSVQAVADPSLPLYNGLLSRLQSVVASVGEIRGQLELTNEYFRLQTNTPWARAAIDRFVAVNANVKKAVADLNSFLEQNIRSLNIFSDGQVSNIRKLNDELTDTFKAIVEGVNRLNPKRQASLKKLFAVFIEDLMKLSQMMTGLLASYKQLPSGAAPEAEALVFPSARPTGQGLGDKLKIARKPLGSDPRTWSPTGRMPVGEGLARKPIGSDPRTYTPHGMMGGIYLEIKEMPTRFL